MKNLSILCSAVAILVLVSLWTCANAEIAGYNWLNPIVKNSYDSFYGTPVTGYQEGTTATLMVNVYNQYATWEMNISAIRVWFDWGTYYNASSLNASNPVVISPNQFQTFTMTISLPDVTTATNLVTHSYTIYVDDVNATLGSQQLVNSSSPRTDDSFAVFSADQANVKNYQTQISQYTASTPVFMTAEARQLNLLAKGAEQRGADEYAKGNFAGAALEYQNALTDYQTAWSNETGSVSGFEDAFAALLNSGQAMMALIGSGYTLFGIGFLLMGLGVVIYLIRKSGTPKSHQ